MGAGGIPPSPWSSTRQQGSRRSELLIRNTLTGSRRGARANFQNFSLGCVRAKPPTSGVGSSLDNHPPDVRLLWSRLKISRMSGESPGGSVNWAFSLLHSFFQLTASSKLRFRVAILVGAPVRGLRLVLAFRFTTEKVPKPPIVTFWPSFREDVMPPISELKAASACFFAMPVSFAIFPTRSHLCEASSFWAEDF